MAAPSGRKYSEYDKKYQAQSAQVAKRVARNAARRMLIKNKGKSALKGKDVDHKDGNTGNNSASNLKIMSKSANRSKK